MKWGDEGLQEVILRNIEEIWLGGVMILCTNIHETGTSRLGSETDKRKEYPRDANADVYSYCHPVVRW